jgi:hypothetical protein
VQLVDFGIALLQGHVLLFGRGHISRSIYCNVAGS